MDSNKTLDMSSKIDQSVESTSDDHKYSAVSFDRFGDDLCELILSYLTFKDKIVLEDVCRQWKRTIYDKQTVLQVFRTLPDKGVPNFLYELTVQMKTKNINFGYNRNMRTIDVKRLKSLLNKCKNIKKIELNDVYIDGLLLELIAQMCPNLQSIELDLFGLEEKDIINFGQKCGPNLQHIRFNNLRVLNSVCIYSEYGRKILSFCTNIKSIQCEDISLVNDTRVDIFPKLESIELILKPNDWINFERFIDKYEKRLKQLGLGSLQMDFQTLINTMEQISRLKNIEDLNISLELMFENNENLNPISDKLTEIAKNCPKISRLDLNIDINGSENETEFISGTIWQSLGTFVNLRQLEVELNLLQTDETVKALRRLKHLTHLSIMCPQMGHPFFKDIDLFLPHLKILKLWSDYCLSDRSLKSLSKLKNLTQIYLGNDCHSLELITDLGISKLLDNCPKLRRIEFRSPPNITHKTVDNLIEFANKNPKNDISFVCLSGYGDESQFAYIGLSAYTNIPNNLKIII